MPALTSHKICRDTDASWWELRVSTNSSDCYRPHTHDEYSIGIVDAGTAVFQHPEGPTGIGPGAVVLIEPHVVHCCNPSDLQRWTYRMLFLRADWLHDAMSRHWASRSRVWNSLPAARPIQRSKWQSTACASHQPI